MTTTDVDLTATVHEAAAAAAAVLPLEPEPAVLPLPPEAVPQPDGTFCVELTIGDGGRLSLQVDADAEGVDEAAVGAAARAAAEVVVRATGLPVVEQPAPAEGTGRREAALLDLGGTPVATLLVRLPAADELPRPRTPSEPTSAAAAPAPRQPDLRRMDLLADVPMSVTVELGRTRMAVRDLMSLRPGAIVELDRAAGSPVDLFVNGALIARCEVVVVDEEFAVRVLDLVDAAEEEGPAA